MWEKEIALAAVGHQLENLSMYDALGTLPLWAVIVAWALFGPVLAVASLWYGYRGETRRDRILGRFVLPLILLSFTVATAYVGFLLVRMP